MIVQGTSTMTPFAATQFDAVKLLEMQKESSKDDIMERV